MPYQMIVLVIVAVAALAIAAYALLIGRYRREIIGRTMNEPEISGSNLVIDLRRSPTSWIGERLRAIAPAEWGEDTALRTKLIQAGYDGLTAPLVYMTIRVIMLVGLPLLMAPFFSTLSFSSVMLLGGAGILIGWILPIWYLDNRVRRRQERIRRSVPDGLDLLVVCIEAGVSLDAAILRVSRELSRVHHELSNELLIVNRKTNAGVPREQALRGLWDRTGVEEIRALVSTMIQSEKWGTSIGNVLTVYAETLRRKRRQAVEKKAATAPLKMLFPLIAFILPALFIIIMGPAAMLIGKMLKNLGGS